MESGGLGTIYQAIEIYTGKKEIFFQIQRKRNITEIFMSLFQIFFVCVFFCVPQNTNRKNEKSLLNFDDYLKENYLKE